MTKHLALLVDGDHLRSEKLVRALSARNIATDMESSSRAAVARLSERRYDVLIVCESAAKDHLEEFCRYAHRYAPPLTIVASLTERKPELEERLFDMGLDDIVTDRTSPTVVAKQIEARVRSWSGKLAASGSIRLGDAIINFDALQVWNRGGTYRFSKGLARLLRHMIENRTRPITRREASEVVWINSRVDPGGRNLDMQVVKLRRLIESDPKNPTVIKTVRGVGYVLSDSE